MALFSLCVFVLSRPPCGRRTRGDFALCGVRDADFSAVSTNHRADVDRTLPSLQRAGSSCRARTLRHLRYHRPRLSAWASRKKLKNFSILFYGAIYNASFLFGCITNCAFVLEEKFLNFFLRLLPHGVGTCGDRWLGVLQALQEDRFSFIENSIRHSQLNIALFVSHRGKRMRGDADTEDRLTPSGRMR